MEWSDPWNPFNSAKLMYHAERWSQIPDGVIPTPVMISIDPCNDCPYQCIFCNAEQVMTGDVMSAEYMSMLVELMKTHHVGAACVGGGGEPLLNPNLSTLLYGCYDAGIEVGLITMGRDLDEFLAIKTCRFIGVSMDAGTPETHENIKGAPHGDFDQICNNMEHLAGLTDLTWKYLLWPGNCGEVYRAAWLAREIGCNRFQVRPGSRPWDAQIGALYTKRDIEVVNEQFERIFDLETDSFKAYGVTHKFRTDLSFRRFDTCLAGFIACVIQPNHVMSICCDRRGDPTTELGKVDSVKDFGMLWGSDHHKEVVKDLDMLKCPRCTYAPHMEMFHHVILEDDMMVNFI